MQLFVSFSKIKLVIYMEKLRRKRRVRIDRVMILVGGCLLALLLVIGAITAIFKLINPTLIAKEYSKPALEIKLEGEKVDSDVYTVKNKETGEKYIYAIHLPVLNNEAKNVLNSFVEEIKAENALVTHIDFSSTSAFSQYKSYVITATTYSDIDGLNPFNPIKTEELYINFDKEELIDLDDCVRGKAISNLAKKYSCDEENVRLVNISETGVKIDVNGTKVDYLYQENNTDFVMNNENVPSILKYEKINVEKREIDPTKPMIAFTFDDGPSPSNTMKILEALDKVGGRATFFQLGYLMENYPDTVRAVTQQGSEVANHSYDHDWLTSKSVDAAVEDIQSVNDIFFSLTGNEINLVRPPYGDYNTALVQAFSEDVVMWDVDTRDWESRNVDSIISMTKKYAYDGAIVLFHDIYSTTSTAAVELIKYYDSLGYQFVTVSELIEMRE